MSELTTTEEISLGADFATAQAVEMEAAEDLDQGGPPDRPKKLRVVDGDADEEPLMSDPGWSDFAMRHFAEDELDRDGRPLVHGLRRVARLLLGPIVRSEAKVVQAPSLLNQLEKVGMLQPAVVEYTVEILMCRTEAAQMAAYSATFTDAADVYHGNTDPDFARHATAMACTRAEARCLRKALQLKGIAGEERTVVPSIDAGLNGMVGPEQVNFINVLCRRNNIDAFKFINAGKKKYQSVWDVEAGVAAKMVEHLAGIENSGKVPAGLTGYDPKWSA